RGLQAPGLRELRPHLVLENARDEVCVAERGLRAVSPLGDRLHRCPWGPLTRHTPALNAAHPRAASAARHPLKGALPAGRETRTRGNTGFCFFFRGVFA